MQYELTGHRWHPAAASRKLPDVIRRIELINFMSHTHTVIEPADGLTVLAGPNNCGKSAVVAALQILCHNDNSTYVTRHNEKECSVIVETDDGHVIEWRRKNNSPRYIIDGRPFDRLERGGIPDGLHDVLRLAKVTADGNREFDVHFGEQKSPVFLLDKAGSHAAQFFASSSDTASLIEMQKLHQRKLADARRERAQLEVKALKLAIDVEALAATDGIQRSVEQAETQHQQFQHQDITIRHLGHDVQTLDAATALLVRHQLRADACVMLTLPPVLETPDPLKDLIAALAHTRSDLEQQTSLAISLSALPMQPDMIAEQPLAELVGSLQSAHLISLRTDGRCDAMGTLISPPLMIESEPLRISTAEIAALSGEVTASQNKLAALEQLAAPPQLDEEVVLAKDVLALSEGVAAVWRAQAILGQLDALAAAPAMVDIREMEGALDELQRATAAVSALTGDLMRAGQEMRDGEHLLRSWAEQQKLCPTCGSPLDASRVVAHTGSCAGGHGHA